MRRKCDKPIRILMGLFLITLLVAAAQQASAQMSPPLNLGGLPTPANFTHTIRSNAANFSEQATWESFDPGNHAIGVDLDGFYANEFDGRYVYFAPYFNDAFHGEVLRYDTQLSFGDEAAWNAFDPGANGVGSDPDGFTDVIFDGQFLYFVPLFNGQAFSGEFLRFDTTGPFADAASWTTFDPGANGVGNDADGYTGAAFDGRFLYFAPYHNGTALHGEVLRFDTEGIFDDATSWRTFDPNLAGLGVEPAGFYGAAFDGQYVYFTPLENSSGKHGEVLRYDTTGAFETLASWAAFTPSDNGVGSNAIGYTGQLIADGYLYLSPGQNNGGFHGEVLRFDLSAEFQDPAAWSSFDPGSHGVGSDPDGYYDIVFDGQYLYFTPYYNGTDYHGEFLRYDTRGEFDSGGSWHTFTPANNGIGTLPYGYLGAIQAGEALYFTPFYEGTNYHGEILKLALDRDVQLSWESLQPEAPEGVIHYQVFKNGNLVADVTESSWTDSAPAPGDIYALRALDNMGNASTFVHSRSTYQGVGSQTADTTMPEIRFQQDAVALSGLIELTILATDGSAGGDDLAVALQVGSAAWQPLIWNELRGEYITFVDTTLYPEGLHSLQARVVDPAGNETIIAREVNIVSITPTAINLGAIGQRGSTSFGRYLAIGGVVLLALATAATYPTWKRHDPGH